MTSPAFSRQSFSGFAVTVEPRAGGKLPMRVIATLKRRGIRIPGLRH
ncbi:hypothetical protein [Rhodopseudomonas telluris]|uniref:Uncharacterized protein n=1 Tax=Rhodopseudomonas telluris TaxID=644215 RepID=A0ABV6EUF0_9BRAD